MSRRGAQRPAPQSLELSIQVAYVCKYAHQQRSEVMTWTLRTFRRMLLITSMQVARENGDA